MGGFEFDECEVPEASRLGPEGAGFSLFNHMMEWERSLIQASHVGAMARQLDDCIAYAKRRHQFGKPIGTFQSVANRIADMRVRLETARLLLYKLAWMKQHSQTAAARSGDCETPPLGVVPGVQPRCRAHARWCRLPHRVRESIEIFGMRSAA